MRKLVFVLLEASAILIAGSGLRAAPLAASKQHTLVRRAPVLTVDPTVFADDIVVYARVPSEGWAITETINEPPVNLAIVTDGLVRGATEAEAEARRIVTDGVGRGATEAEADARRMDHDWERQSKMDATVRR